MTVTTEKDDWEIKKKSVCYSILIGIRTHLLFKSNSFQHQLSFTSSTKPLKITLISNIFIISLNTGKNVPMVKMFHKYLSGFFRLLGKCERKILFEIVAVHNGIFFFLYFWSFFLMNFLGIFILSVFKAFRGFPQGKIRVIRSAIL